MTFITIEAEKTCKECEFIKECLETYQDADRVITLHALYMLHRQIFHLNIDLIDASALIAKFNSARKAEAQANSQNDYHKKLQNS